MAIFKIWSRLNRLLRSFGLIATLFALFFLISGSKVNAASTTLTLITPSPVYLPNTVDLTTTIDYANSYYEDDSHNIYDSSNLDFYYYSDAAYTTPVPDPTKVSISGRYYVRAIEQISGSYTASNTKFVWVSVYQTICNGSTFVITPSGMQSGTTYTWPETVTYPVNPVISPAGSITGGSASTEADVEYISQTLSLNTGRTAPATATYYIKYLYYIGSTKYDSKYNEYFPEVVTVNPLGQVNQPPNQTVCAGEATSVTFETVNTGGTTTYSWTNNTTSVGLAGSGSGDISFTAANSTSSPITATINVTPTFTNNAVSCTGATKSFTITVRPTPTASISGTTAVCTGAANPTITFTNPQTLPETVTYNINGGTNTTIAIGATATATVTAPTTTAGTYVYNLVLFHFIFLLFLFS